MEKEVERSYEMDEVYVFFMDNEEGVHQHRRI